MAPLAIGPLSVWPPVVLAPMAGVTNAPFRRLCRRFGAGLYVSEMVLAPALLHGSARTERMLSFDADESPRSVQLYGSDPALVGAAVARLVGEGRVDHVDLNFGCPARKVTRKGGGAAVPLKPRLLAAIIRAAVEAAAPDGCAGHGEVPPRAARRPAHVAHDWPHRRGGGRGRGGPPRPDGGAALRGRRRLGRPSAS